MTRVFFILNALASILNLFIFIVFWSYLNLFCVLFSGAIAYHFYKEMKAEKELDK